MLEIGSKGFDSLYVARAGIGKPSTQFGKAT
jgi:hypothetical protein